MDDVFRSFIMPAIIAAIVSIISSAITSIVAYKTTKQMITAENERLKISMDQTKQESDRQLSIQYISNERIRWIQELRRTFSSFRAHTTEAAFRCRDNNGMVPDYSLEINQEAIYLKLLLKRNGGREKKINDYINDVISGLGQINRETVSMKLYFDSMEGLTTEIQIYLKMEWERVKCEVKGDVWDEEKFL